MAHPTGRTSGAAQDARLSPGNRALARGVQGGRSPDWGASGERSALDLA